ncbi:MAG: permease [Chloroflexota bacterium]
MTGQKAKGTTWQRVWLRRLAFPVAVLALYGVLFIALPDRASAALRSSGSILWSLLLPLGLVLVVMVFLNLFLKPAQVARFLGAESGVWGVLMSVAAGIISTGPIYAWYPLLKELREKGAGNTVVAIFLGNRAVKPFLLPVMVSYFGWVYVVVLTVFTVVGSVGVGYAVGALVAEQPGRSCDDGGHRTG